MRCAVPASSRDEWQIRRRFGCAGNYSLRRIGLLDFAHIFMHIRPDIIARSTDNVRCGDCGLRQFDRLVARRCARARIGERAGVLHYPRRYSSSGLFGLYTRISMRTIRVIKCGITGSEEIPFINYTRTVIRSMAGSHDGKRMKSFYTHLITNGSTDRPLQVGLYD